MTDVVSPVLKLTEKIILLIQEAKRNKKSLELLLRRLESLKQLFESFRSGHTRKDIEPSQIREIEDLLSRIKFFVKKQGTGLLLSFLKVNQNAAAINEFQRLLREKMEDLMIQLNLETKLQVIQINDIVTRLLTDLTDQHEKLTKKDPEFLTALENEGVDVEIAKRNIQETLKETVKIQESKVDNFQTSILR